MGESCTSVGLMLDRNSLYFVNESSHPLGVIQQVRCLAPAPMPGICAQHMPIPSLWPKAQPKAAVPPFSALVGTSRFAFHLSLQWSPLQWERICC